MATNRRLLSDLDFQEVIDTQARIRVFQDNHIVDSSTVLVRFDATMIITQSGVSDMTYHNRADCEFFELRKR